MLLCMKWRLMAHAIRRFHSSIRTCICVEERRLIVETREKGLTVLHVLFFLPGVRTNIVVIVPKAGVIFNRFAQ